MAPGSARGISMMNMGASACMDAYCWDTSFTWHNYLPYWDAASKYSLMLSGHSMDKLPSKLSGGHDCGSCLTGGHVGENNLAHRQAIIDAMCRHDLHLLIQGILGLQSYRLELRPTPRGPPGSSEGRCVGHKHKGSRQGYRSATQEGYCHDNRFDQ